MGVDVRGQVGPRIVGDGSENIIRTGRTGEQIVADAHGRFYEAAARGTVFSGGMTATSISNVTFTSGTLGATETPIAGVWNPSNSGKNLVILQATVSITVTAATATGIGTLVWAVSAFNVAITTGNAPFNRSNLQNIGSVAKDMSGVALTGLTNNMAVKFGSAMNAGNVKNISSVETAVGQNIAFAGSLVDNFDGSLIIPPGGVLALLCTTTPVAHTAASSIVWEEVSTVNVGA